MTVLANDRSDRPGLTVDNSIRPRKAIFYLVIKHNLKDGGDVAFQRSHRRGLASQSKSHHSKGRAIIGEGSPLSQNIVCVISWKPLPCHVNIARPISSKARNGRLSIYRSLREDTPHRPNRVAFRMLSENAWKSQSAEWEKG